MANQATINTNFNYDFKIEIFHRITNGYEIITPIVEDGVKWETDRQGSPGKLTFRVYSDKNNKLDFQEGECVVLKYNDGVKGWTPLVKAYIFTKKRNKDGWIDVTAYDQLRYFKNKATYVYTNKKASDVIKMIAKDYNLATSKIEDTSYTIGSRVEDDQSLFDIAQNALDLTLISTTDMYVLYADDVGICLQNALNMRTNVVINELTAEDFDYTSSIDDETYNEVELYYDNDETNKREYYNAIDSKNVSNWGRLRYTESIQNPANARDRATKMLKLYNQKTRKLTVTKAFGDVQCRAGASVIVNLNVGDLIVSNYMLIEKATHIFKKDEYRMDLTLNGFNANDDSGVIIYNESNVVTAKPNTNSGYNSSTNSSATSNYGTGTQMNYTISINVLSAPTYAGDITVDYYNFKKERATLSGGKSSFKVFAHKDTPLTVTIKTRNGHSFQVIDRTGDWSNNTSLLSKIDEHTYTITVTQDAKLDLRWVR